MDKVTRIYLNLLLGQLLGNPVQSLCDLAHIVGALNVLLPGDGRRFLHFSDAGYHRFELL